LLVLLGSSNKDGKLFLFISLVAAVVNLLAKFKNDFVHLILAPKKYSKNCFPMNNNNRSSLDFDFFETLFNKARENNILIADENGIILAINNSFSASFGYTEEDIIGKSVKILFTKEDQERGLPEHEYESVLHNGQAYDNNYLVNKDKSITWVSGETVLVKDHKGATRILKVIQNIHKQKESELELKRLNDFNESILASIADVVIIVDNKLNIIKANNAFAGLFRDKVPEISTINIASLIKPYDKNDELLHSLQQAAVTGNSFSNRQLEVSIPSLQKRIFEVSCTPLRDFANNNMLLVVHDITIYKTLEREREDTIGFVAHEIKTPVANMTLINDIMQKAIAADDMELIKKMQTRNANSVARLQKIISELYEVSTINSGNINLETSVFNFDKMVKEAIDTVELLHPSFKINFDGGADVDVCADRYRLIQVINNYIGNAIKYSDKKSTIEIASRLDQNSVIFSVKDEGIGIPKEELPYIFERFYRAEKSTNIEGIGLGLFLCQQIIKAHKGYVWAESSEGKGSVFYFSIPINK
jgi:PAS domain S-box-containing protein